MQLQTPDFRCVADRLLWIVRGVRQRPRIWRQLQHALSMRDRGEEICARRTQQCVVRSGAHFFNQDRADVATSERMRVQRR